MKNKYLSPYPSPKTPLLAVTVLIVVYCLFYAKWLQPRPNNLSSPTLSIPLSSPPSPGAIKKTVVDKSPLPLTINSAKLIKLLRQSVAVTAPSLASSASVNSPVMTARCSYNGQNYVAGDIINTPPGWLRCSPTFIFLPPHPNLPQANSVAWTAAQ